LIKKILENILNQNTEITIPEEITSTKNEIKSDENVILLKGRTRKVPRSINYNELFANHLNEKNDINFNNKKFNNTQIQNQNKNYYNSIYENPNENKTSNFEDFFDQINQNKKVLEILNQQTEKLNIVTPIQQQKYIIFY